jgi:hypothetical protein
MGLARGLEAPIYGRFRGSKNLKKSLTKLQRYAIIEVCGSFCPRTSRPELNASPHFLIFYIYYITF